MKKIINYIVWTITIAIPAAAIVYGIIIALQNPQAFLWKAIDVTAVGFVVFAAFGLLGIIIKFTEKKKK